MNWSALSEAPGRESAARRVLWTRRVFEGAGARPGVLSTGISILAVSDGPIMHLGTNVPRDYFVAFFSPSKSARRQTFPPRTDWERRHFSASPRHPSTLASLLSPDPPVSGRPSTGRSMAPERTAAGSAGSLWCPAAVSPAWRIEGVRHECSRSPVVCAATI